MRERMVAAESGAKRRGNARSLSDQASASAWDAWRTLFESASALDVSVLDLLDVDGGPRLQTPLRDLPLQASPRGRKPRRAARSGR